MCMLRSDIGESNRSFSAVMKPLCFWKSRRLCVHSANAAVHSTRSLQSEPRLLRRLVIAVWWHTRCMHGARRTKVSEKSHPGPMHAETHWADHGLGFALTFWMLSGQNLSPVAGFLWFPTYGWPHLVSHPQSENRESIKHNSFIWLYCLKIFLNRLYLFVFLWGYAYVIIGSLWKFEVLELLELELKMTMRGLECRCWGLNSCKSSLCS